MENQEEGNIQLVVDEPILEEDQRVAQAEENQRVAQAEEERRVAQAEENQRVAQAEENQRVAQAEENQRVAQAEEERRVAQAEEERRVAQAEEDQRVAYANAEEEQRVAYAKAEEERRAVEQQRLLEDAELESKRRLQELLDAEIKQAVVDVVSDVPKLVFIVPYRDREQQLVFFKKHMEMILENKPPTEYKIYYIHQNDARDFNRGAMKNIGFHMVKNKYPEDYKDITLVFNDVDTMPFTKDFLNYDTTPGTVKHFYGVTFALGGIVSMKAGDFERVRGFPNFWAWGFEDNLLNARVLQAGFTVDRSQFYPLMDKNIFQMKDGLTRLVNRGEYDRYINETDDGLDSIFELQYDVDEESGLVHVNRFSTPTVPDPVLSQLHDLRNGSRPFPATPPVMPLSGRRGKPRMNMYHM